MVDDVKGVVGSIVQSTEVYPTELAEGGRLASWIMTLSNEDS